MSMFLDENSHPPMTLAGLWSWVLSSSNRASSPTEATVDPLEASDVHAATLPGGEQGDRIVGIIYDTVNLTENVC